MKTYPVKHIHLGDNGFSGIIGFVVDNRLFNFNFISPSFNDYAEIRITSAAISLEAYQPETNEVELTPSKSIPDFEITQKELDFLELYFSSDYVNNYKYLTHEKSGSVYDERNIDQDKLNDFIAKYGEKPVFPFDYLAPDEFCVATFLDMTSKEQKLSDLLTLFVPIKRNKCDYFDSNKIKLSDWSNKNDITERLGMFNFFVPVLNGLSKIV